MELQVVIIGAVVFVVSAVLIYLISAFTMKEKTFEEVIAEQKRQQELELQKAKQDKKAEKDSRRKFKKKEKSKGDQSPKASVEDQEAKEHKMVNLEIEPEIIEPQEEKPLKTLRKREKPGKPILHNKDEKAPVLSEENIEEIVHRGPVPMDDLELKILHESKKEKSKSKDKAKKQESEMKQPKPVVEDIVKSYDNKVQAAPPQSAYSDPKTSFRDNDSSKLISSVKSASLNDAEVQSLIDVLLNKQGGASAAADWNKKSQKGDPVALLRKQLEEKERSLQEEQQMVMAANTKLKEIKQELNQEKINASTIEKKYKEKMEYQVRETQALHARLQHTHDQHMMETNQMRGMIAKLESAAGDQSRVNVVQEENKNLRESLTKLQSESVSAADMSSLKAKVSIMEKELSSNAMKLNAKENAIKSLEQEAGKLRAQLQNQQQSNAGPMLEKRNDELSAELRKTEAKVSALNKDLGARDQAVDAVHKECATLKGQLQELQKSLTTSDTSARGMEERLKEADRRKIDMEGNLKNLQKKLDNYNVEKSEILSEVQALKQENSNITRELKTATEQQQKAPPNGHLEASIPVAEHEKIVADKDNKLSQLTSEVEGKKKELSTIQQDFETQKKKNNELREKNWKAMDALEKSEKSVSEKVQSAIKERERERLLEATSSSVTDLEKYDKSVLQRLYPDISVTKTNHKDWMVEFEKQVSSQQKTTVQQVQSSNEDSAKLVELQERTRDLQTQLTVALGNESELKDDVEEKEAALTRLNTQVAQYRDVLGETENKLTQLENSVESEEKKWQERFAGKELELQQSQQELSNLRKAQSSSKGEDEDMSESDIGFAYRCVEKSLASIVDEMKIKVEVLESDLADSNSRCAQLEKQIEQSETKVVEYSTQVVELQKTSAGATDLSKELEELRKTHEGEKKKNKELASQIVRLNGTIKTGYDALTQEQQLVEKLKQQLADKGDKTSNSVPNDSNTEVKTPESSPKKIPPPVSPRKKTPESSPNKIPPQVSPKPESPTKKIPPPVSPRKKAPSSAETSPQKLRTRLAEKEKQLEKEISSNKLLTQRLAASQSSLNEAGTSV